MPTDEELKRHGVTRRECEEAAAELVEWLDGRQVPALRFMHLDDNRRQSDTSWILSQLDKAPARKHFELCVGYSVKYCEGYEAEPDEIKKENAARRVANTWLRSKTK
jgi:hypothetical protein